MDTTRFANSFFLCVLLAGSAAAGIDGNDSYTVVRKDGEFVIEASSPRCRLYAQYDRPRWENLGEGESFTRTARFKYRMVNYGASSHPMADWIAATGCNMVHLGRNIAVTLEESMPEVFARLPQDSQEALKKARRQTERAQSVRVGECHDLDVEAYPLLYGCNAAKWNKALLEAFLEEHPSAKAVAPTNSWEKGVLCPSDEWTWKFVGAYAREFATAAGFDGLVVTFWDDYGLNCKCKRCKKNGMDTFGRQVAAMVKCLDNAITPLGKKLIVRTWASGAPHWLGDEWVHAPGYAGEADAAATWNEAMKEASGNVIFQTKVYNCDCQPDAPFSNLLGKSGGREEFAEWQITGQTVGLQWLPAAVVKHTKGTFERVKKMANVDGVCLYAGGYNNPGYEALDDVMNSVNLHVWRQLSWNPDEELDDLLREWALVRHGTGDADKIAEAMALSEDAAVASFSPLGLGAPTESRFAKTVSRREDLLRYTNRHYLPDGHAALIPSDENIARVAAQKDRALAATRRMEELFSTCNDVPQDVRKEFLMRTEWLRTHLECSRALDVALWNFRMVRYLSEMGLGDAKYAAAIDGQFGELRKLHKSLFAHDADAKVSFYPDGFGGRKIALDSPVPLMRDIAERAKKCMEIVAGPQD